MCGFAGFVGKTPFPGAEAVLEKMGSAIAHRGPDAAGIWLDGNLSVGLTHRRLSIMDLSELGAQPMASESGRYVIAFNGEIYNFRQLSKELEADGAQFRGHSDTEVMLAAFEAWGVEPALQRLSGMFAFALVDKRFRKFYLARDRMGEKPLYYGWQGESLLFGSELRALRQHPAWQGAIDTSVLPALLRHNVIPAPRTIHQGICKLPPASYVCLDLDHPQSGQLPDPQRYWMLETSFKEHPGYTLESAADELERLLKQSISDQMVSDVPLGAFLSGGIDSSTVVGIMQSLASQPVRTFSIGFHEKGFNEAEHAAAVAKHLGTEHTELYVTEREARNLVPDIPGIYDEPFADSSQIPTYLVSQMTRKHVTVALSGDGGDELFCGYTRYPGMLVAWNKRSSIISHLKRIAGSLPPGLSARFIRAIVSSQKSRSLEAIQYQLRRIQSIAGARDLSDFYRRSVSLWPDPAMALKDAGEYSYGLNMTLAEGIPDNTLKTLMWRDLNWYLPDDILTKVDRAAMACSLETRIPMLDPAIVSFALGLPEDLNLRGGVGKQVLRAVLYRYVPRQLIDRPKQGFAVPVAAWLRGGLREWAEELLAEHRLNDQGYWHTKRIRWLWEEHLSGREDYSFELWGILMFQAWFDHNQS
ncbi:MULTISPECIES: asparagine synthase (glutamine-hydrolyzing) [unclassified Marinobacter]|uniref:asparagine synthase (glutamine-hydrolyzing) n=1 Tax=unclassified Marinobacter TaxID=83889 RepID=UPI0012689A79|nr:MULTISPECIES: asparagine synthase (glutamine-hydrolyzing) [unclassified Marinobacter]QFS86933.1 Asparagine synthetase [glutamine-hydrolyzing] 1 [Marinobacter sp. THAF197a]QFT50717.1 Asparagine synthetase [glutamine-hydrolyzing] 1 [Marinobacter sp. THAF39]